MRNSRHAVLPDASRLGMVELGVFRLRSLLGRGSCGTAFLAENGSSGRDAVVKIAHAADADHLEARFASEVRAANLVDHPNVVEMFTAGETSDGLPALAMEFVPGVPLEDILEERGADLPRMFIRDVFAQLGSAIAAFHNASVTHRELSPANIIVGDGLDGSVVTKLLDFGAACLGPDPGRVSLVGTTRYPAPEQIVGAGGPATDLYALGALLWWALSGSEFQPDVRTLADLSEARLMGTRPKDIRRLAPDVPDDVAALLSELLAFEPKNRPTAPQFCERWGSCGLVEPDAPMTRQTVATQSRKPFALCLDDDPVRVGNLREHLERAGWDFEVASPDEPMETLARPGVIFVSGDLPGEASVAVLRRAAGLFAGVTIVAMIWSERERAAMIRAGADFAIRVPFDLPHIAEALEEAQAPDAVEAAMTLPFQVAPQSRSVPEPPPDVESFLGRTPELIADIGEAIEHQNVPMAVEACTQLRQQASRFGGQELVKLVAACAAFAKTHDFHRAAEYGALLEDEYGNLFRRLMAPPSPSSGSPRLD